MGLPFLIWVCPVDLCLSRLLDKYNARSYMSKGPGACLSTQFSIFFKGNNVASFFSLFWLENVMLSCFCFWKTSIPECCFTAVLAKQFSKSMLMAFLFYSKFQLAFFTFFSERVPGWFLPGPYAERMPSFLRSSWISSQSFSCAKTHQLWWWNVIPIYAVSRLWKIVFSFDPSQLMFVRLGS